MYCKSYRMNAQKVQSLNRRPYLQAALVVWVFQRVQIFAPCLTTSYTSGLSRFIIHCQGSTISRIPRADVVSVRIMVRKTEPERNSVEWLFIALVDCGCGEDGSHQSIHRLTLFSFSPGSSIFKAHGHLTCGAQVVNDAPDLPGWFVC